MIAKFVYKNKITNVPYIILLAYQWLKMLCTEPNTFV